MNNKKLNFIQSNSPDGGFLQSVEWRKFQESAGRKTFIIEDEYFNASIIEHSLPVAGNYFYIPKGPIFNFQFSIFNQFSSNNDKIFKQKIQELINLAEKENIGWIRIEPSNSRILGLIRENWRVVKAPHDMQPKEILVLDITKSEEELLAEMKSKTRYNIKLAQKKGVKIHLISNSPNSSNKIPNNKIQISNQIQNPNSKNCHSERSEPACRQAGNLCDLNFGISRDARNDAYIGEFIRLVKITAERDKITPHPENYYRKMFEIIPGDILKLYVAEYENNIIAANLVIFYGNVCTYLHGASDNERRSLMAPYLLQWEAIKDAKRIELTKYDFGGIHTKTGEGITKFKTGFAPNAKPVEFPGSYDIIISPMKYKLYRIIQKIKGFAR